MIHAALLKHRSTLWSWQSTPDSSTSSASYVPHVTSIVSCSPGARMSPPSRLGPQLGLPTEVTRISTIEKSELFWTWSDASELELLLQPATASPPSAATTQAKNRRFCMAGHSSNDRAVG